MPSVHEVHQPKKIPAWRTTLHPPPLLTSGILWPRHSSYVCVANSRVGLGATGSLKDLWGRGTLSQSRINGQFLFRKTQPLQPSYSSAYHLNNATALKLTQKIHQVKKSPPKKSKFRLGLGVGIPWGLGVSLDHAIAIAYGVSDHLVF